MKIKKPSLHLLRLCGKTMLTCLLLSSFAQAQQTYQATIYRDAYGSPHVFAAKDADVLFGMAYALAEDDWPLIEENYVRALGRSAGRDAWPHHRPARPFALHVPQ